MKMRIITVNELDGLLASDEVHVKIDVDAPEGFFKNADLAAVYNNGSFEIYPEVGPTISLKLHECKVFATI